METIIGLYKTECIRTTIFHDQPFETIADVEYATAGWVEHLRGLPSAYGITLREGWHAALPQWAQDTPGQVLAASLGLHITTAVAWPDAIQADYTDFVATRSATSPM